MSIKFSRILPAVNIALAITLFFWGYHSRPPFHLPWVATPTLVCYGINAPALRISSTIDQLFSFPSTYSLSRIPHSSEILLAITLTVIWYLVGKRLDEARSANSSVEPLRGIRLLWKLLVLLYGLNLLIVIFLHNIFFTNPKNGNGTRGDNNFLGEVIFQGFWLIWSLVLIIVPTRDLLVSFHRSKGALPAPNSAASG